jgi:signal transduction histidine kinase
VIDARRGDVRAMEDLYHLRGGLTFVGVFAATIVLPGLMLAYYGIAGVRAEQRAGASEVQRAADSAADVFSVEAAALFRSFEDATFNRLKSGQTLTTGLRELSGSLRVAFRFDADGTMTAPFTRRLPEDEREDETRLAGPFASGLAMEAAGDGGRAATLFAEAARLAPSERTRIIATFSRGRALQRGGEAYAAEAVLADVAAAAGAVRDGAGFRVADLARLKRAEILVGRDPAAGDQALRQLVEALFAETWTIGESGAEAAVARRALDLVSGKASANWVAQARGRLDERSSQLYWAERLVDELDTLGAKGKLLRTEMGTVSYRRTDSALWATTWTEEEEYILGLELRALLRELEAVADRAAGTDSDVAADVLPTDAPVPNGVRVRRSLAWLPGYHLVVFPRDPAALARRQADERRRGIGIIFLSVVMITVGTILSQRLVRRELDAARVKSDFAANVSHELRSPITQIRLKAEALQLGLATDEASQQRHFDVIVRESERLSQLVDNMLDFAAIERGQKKYTLRPGDLGATVARSVELAKVAMELRGMEVDLVLPEDLPMVHHDPDAVGQLMANLLSNAAKYGQEAGWIKVVVAPGPTDVRVSVSDGGIGISAEEQRAIFEQYYRSNDPKARRRKGTGIGLTIVRYIMEAHGGRVEVTSSPGQGATFTLRFPLTAPADRTGG